MKTPKVLLCVLGLAGLASLPSQAALVETPGFLKYECWFPTLRDTNLVGTTVAILVSDPNYQNNLPDMVSYSAGLNSRTVFPDDSHEQYGDRISGWITPTVTGNYNFYISSDDSSQLYISTDSTTANLQLVAEETGCCNPFQEPGHLQTTAAPLALQAGQQYAIQVLHKEGTGGDYVQVAWQEASGTNAAASLVPLTSTVLSSMADPTGASLNITQQPLATTVAENTPTVTFSIGATGVTPYKQYTGTGSDSNGQAVPGGPVPLGITNNLPLFYQWFTNGVEVAGANATNYTFAWPKKATDNGLKVKCYVAVPGIPLYSSEVTLTVTNDVTPPTAAQANADFSFTNVVVQFSEPVSDSALLASDYSISPSVTVASVSRLDPLRVQLSTSKMAENTIYTLTINGVQDTAAPANTIAPNTTLQFRSFVYLAGTILHKKYNNTSDSYTLANFLADPRYPNNPDRLDLESACEYPPGGVGRIAADPVRNYCDTLEGYFVPSTTASYVFFTSGADEYYLYLSTDDSPANVHQICSEPGGWTNARDWLTGQGGVNMATMRSDQYTGTQWPTTDPGTGLAIINLTAGQRYYFLEMHHDHSWSGGDFFAATYKLSTDQDPADGTAPALTGSTIGYYFDPTGASINFVSSPQNVVIIQGASANFSGLATGTSVYGTNVFYQWQSAPKGSTTWSSISGATSATYKTPLLALSDSGTQFRLIATVPPISETSSVATLTVTLDTTPPVASVGAMLDPVAGTVDLGVGFNKPIDASVGQLANYSVTPGTITGLTVYTNRFTANSQNPLAKVVRQSVLLTVTGVSGSGTLTIKNVSDTLGNTLVSTNIPFTVAANVQWGVVGANQTGGWNAVVPVAPNGFDVYSDGVGEWSEYDETTFVYEQVTGDFDKKLRVEYQDGSSEWARAGLIVRDVTNFGVDEPTQAGSQPNNNTPVYPYDGKAGRYQKIHVNPVGATLTGPGTGGNASWEGNRRLDTGGGCTSAITGANSTPLYPNAWCRLQRVGQKFTIYRSDDGVNWVNLGSTTWGVDDTSKTPMPATVYVGPEFSPENGNITQAADQGTFLAQIRDYGNYVAVFSPQLNVGIDPTGKVTITWGTGTLVSSPTVQGTYAPVTGAISPLVVTPAPGTATFYKVKQ